MGVIPKYLNYDTSLVSIEVPPNFYHKSTLHFMNDLPEHRFVDRKERQIDETSIDRKFNAKF